MQTPRSRRYVSMLCWTRLAVAGADSFASRRTGDRLERSLLGVLAARHLLQLALTVAKPTRKVVAAGATVDALHSLSMVGLAAASPTHRRGAITDAALAGALATAGGLLSVGWESLT